MSIPTVTLEDAKTLLTAIVEEFGPDHVNGAIDGSCRYFAEGEPSCGVGQLLARIGITHEMLDSFENHTAIRCLLKERADTGDEFVNMDAEAVDFLQDFQYRQDSGTAWGDALSSALATLN